MKKNNKKIIKQLTKLKFYAYELNRNYQLPYDLYVLICRFDDNTSEKEVKFLKELTEHFLRVKGYYKLHCDEHEAVNKKVMELYKEFVNR